MKRSSRTFALASLALLAACGKPVAPGESASTASGNPGSLLASPKVAPSAQVTQPSPNTPSATPDPSVPIQRYTDLNALPGGFALSLIVSAKAPAPMAVEERLDRLSPTYHSERDVFKRQEIAKTELPRVDAELAKYQKQSYYSLPIANYTPQALALTNVSVGAYQAASKSFPLMGYGTSCWAGVIRNSQGAVLQLGGGGPACSLTVPDEATARAIESARANHSLHLDGTAYVFVPQADKGAANGVVAAAHIVLTEGSQRSPLGRFDLRGS